MDNSQFLQKLNFKQFVKEVAKRTNMSMVEAEPIIRIVFDCIKYFLYNGYKIYIPKFGIFRTVKMKGRIHRLLPKKDTVWKKAHYKPTFHFTAEFKKQMKKIEVKDDFTEKRKMDN